jgi:hypothetical protein
MRSFLSLILTVIIINQGKGNMRRYTITFTLFLMVFVIGLVYSSSARVQEKTKRAVSKIQFYRKEITPPVEYSGLKIKDKTPQFSSMFEEGNEKLQKALLPEMEFEEDDDFWEHLSFDVTNVSDKTIVYLRTNIYLYTREGVQDGSSQASMAIEFGNPLKFGPPYEESLKPGESKTFTVPEFQMDYARQKARQLTSPIIRVGIFARDIYFADGFNWTFDGRVFPPKSNKSSQNGQSNLKNRFGREAKFPMLQQVAQEKKVPVAWIIDLLRRLKSTT